MKKLLLPIVIMLFFACSKEENDCSNRIAEINEFYTKVLDNNISDEQRREITAKYKEDLANPCNF